MRLHPPARAVVLTAALFLVLAFLAHSVSAHALLVSSTPSAGTTITQAPAVVQLTFTDPTIAPPTSGATVMLAGAVVSAGAPSLDATGAIMTVALKPALGAGLYQVTWRTVSAVDGDLATGSFSFTVTAAETLQPAVMTPDQRAVAHGVGAAALPALPLTPSGTHAFGSGYVVLGGFGTLRQPTIFLTGVMPNATFLVQVCYEAPDGPESCAGATVQSNASGSVGGVTVTVTLAQTVTAIMVTNSADAQEVYSVELQPAGDAECVVTVIGDTLIGCQAPDSSG